LLKEKRENSVPPCNRSTIDKSPMVWSLMKIHRKRLLLAGLILLSILVSAALLTKPGTPDGRYVASENIGAVGDWYYELANGKITLVVHEDSSATVRHQSGIYFRTNGVWVVRSRDGVPEEIPTILETSWFGVSSSAGTNSLNFMRRRLISGKRPDWMLDHLPWCIQ
jgi:hypothetical protein